MTRSAAKIFVTGDPGCGKTTAVRRVVERLGPPAHDRLLHRRGARRTAAHRFRGVTLEGKVFTLAGRRWGDFRVGPYGVTLEGLETVGVRLRPAADTRLVVLDEWGRWRRSPPPSARR